MKKLLLSFTILTSIFQLNAQWKQTNGPTGTSVNCFLNEGGTVLAGLHGAGVYRSTDNGDHWIGSNTGSPELGTVYDLLKDGQNILAATNKGTYISSDGGFSWHASNQGISTYKILSLMKSGGKIYAGTYFGIFSSSDGGNSWVSTSPQMNTVNKLHASGNRLFASTYSGLFFSDDQGVSWTQTNQISINNLVTCYLNSNDLLLIGTIDGIFYSKNNGLNWSYSGLQNERISSLISKNGILYAGTARSGIYISHNNGLTWIATNNDVKINVAKTLVFTGNHLLAGTYLKGIFKTSDNGQHWETRNSGLIHSHIPILAGNATTLFAAFIENSVFKSFDEGNTWIFAGNGIIGTYISSLYISGDKIFVGTEKGLSVSTDNGDSWSMYNNLIKDKKILAVGGTSSHLFAGGKYGEVYRSADNGLTWSLSNNGLPSDDVSSITSSSSVLFASVGTQIYQSINNGDSWFIDPSLLNSYKIQEKNGVLFAPSSSHCYFSTDHGSSWITPQEGSPAAGLVFGFEVDGSNWYIATSGGIYTSNDQGITWEIFNDGLPLPIEIRPLFIWRNTLFVGTSGIGVWKRNLSPANETMLFPNPSIGQSTLKFQSDVKAKIEIFDISGKRVKSTDFVGDVYLIDQKDLKSGNYFIRVTLENKSTETHQLVIQN